MSAYIFNVLGLPMWLRVRESTFQCRTWKRRGFNLWVGKIPWSRKWQPAPACLPGKFHGQRSLVSYSPWGHKEVEMTERLNTKWEVCVKCFSHPELWRLSQDRVLMVLLELRDELASLFSSAVQPVGSLFPDQGSNQSIQQWKCRVLTTRPPGEFQISLFFVRNHFSL